MTLTSWARQAIATRSAWRRSVISRQPTTSASARSCVSSASAGARSNPRTSRAASRSRCSVRCQTFHSSTLSPIRRRPGRDARIGIHDRRDALDHPVQVRRAGEVVVDGLVGGRIVVGVQGDVIDRVAGELEHRRLPRAERRHRGPGAAARHELDRRVDEAHGASGLRRATTVVGGTRVTDLPRAVHLVAETPGPDPVRLGMAIGRPPVGDRGADRCVAVLDEVARCVGAAGPEVHREHRLDAGQARPGDELVGADRLGSIDRQARSCRSGRRSRGPTPSSQS